MRLLPVRTPGGGETFSAKLALCGKGAPMFQLELDLEELLVPDLRALAHIYDMAQELEPTSLNMATYWCEPRKGGAGQGCLLGHWAKRSAFLSLTKINFLEELKSPLMRQQLLGRFPNAQWQHYTLCYKHAAVEAYGTTAAMLALRLHEWDLNQLFYPHGSNYEMQPPIASLTERLRLFINSVARNVAPQPGNPANPQVPADG
jgi:hypothetical protein